MKWESFSKCMEIEESRWHWTRSKIPFGSFMHHLKYYHLKNQKFDQFNCGDGAIVHCVDGAIVDCVDGVIFNFFDLIVNWQYCITFKGWFNALMRCHHEKYWTNKRNNQSKRSFFGEDWKKLRLFFITLNLFERFMELWHTSEWTWSRTVSWLAIYWCLKFY